MPKANPKSRGAPGAKRGKPLEKGTQVGKATRWVPGKSGNPMGLPAGYAHVRDLAKEYTGNAIRALQEVADDPTHEARVQAAKALLDRGWDKAEQPIRVTGAELGHLTDAQLKALDAQLCGLEDGTAEGGDSGGEGAEESEGVREAGLDGGGTVG